MAKKPSFLAVGVKIKAGKLPPEKYAAMAGKEHKKAEKPPAKRK